jgi:hypothetical protein
VDARRDWAARIIHSDAPKITKAEGKRPRSRRRSIVEVVTVFLQVFEKTVPLFPAEAPEKFGASFENIDVPPRFVVAQALARRPVICAKIRIGFHCGTVRVEGENIGGHRARVLIAGVTVDAVEDRIEVVRPEQLLILEEKSYGGATRRAHWESQQLCFVKSRDSLADGQMFNNFAEITGQHARPAERVDAVPERSRDQFMETVHQLDAVVAGRQAKCRTHG